MSDIHSVIADATISDPQLQSFIAAIRELAPAMTAAERRTLAADIARQALEAERMGDSAVEAALIGMHGALLGAHAMTGVS